MAMANIYLSNDADYWYESGPIRNMIIRNNEFYIRPTGQNEWGDVSGVYVNPVVLTGVQDAPASKGDIPVHRNITIEGNEFHMANDNAVTATGVDGMKIINNKIIRDDAGIEISMNVADRMEIGEVLDIETDVQETTLGKDVFKFTDCKNVEISGNTYDEGFNLNVITSGNKMTEEDVKIEDEELTLNQPGGNMVTSASHIQYAVSDPTVAYVNEQGQLVGLKDGTVDVVSYIEWDNTVIKSNEISVTVGQGGVSSVEILADKDEINAEGGTAVLTYTEGADISILDPVTRETSGCASVDGNIYTALKEGAVLVHAEKDGKSSEILMINNFEQSYGNPEYMVGDKVAVDNMNPEYLSGAKNEITVTAQSGSELYQQDTYVNNLIKFEIPQDMKEDLRIQVEAEGLPVRGEGYNNAGIMLYKDGNNYYSVGKKGHFNGVTTVYEQNASSSERGGETAANELKDTVFEIEISDNTATMRYMDAEGRWQTADRQENINHITEGTLYLALCAWENEGGEFQTTFKNVKIAKASETSTQDMSKIDPIQIFQGFDNEVPVVADVKLQVNGTGRAAVADAQVSDDGEIGQMIYQWTLTDKEGRKTVEYTSEPTYVPARTGFLKVKVIAVDMYGKSGKQISSEEEVTAEISSEETLEHLYINGNAVQDFDKENAVFYLPEEYADQIRVSYDLADMGVSTILKDEDEKILADLSEINETVVETPDKLIIERGETVYRINIVKQKNNTTTVEGLQVNDQVIDLEKEIRQGTGSYFKQLDLDHARIELQADENVSSITVTTSFFQKEVKNESEENGQFSADVNLTAGINAFYITVTGADGKTQKTITLYLFRDGYNDSALGDLKVNGESLQGFDPEQREYTIYVDSAQEDLFVQAEKADEDQDTELFMGRARTEGASGKYDLKDGLNRIIVKNTSQNIWTTSYYILNVIVSSEKNADLLSLTTDETLTPGFDASNPETTEYEMDVNKDSLHIRAQAQMEDAKIVISTQTERIEGTGSAEHDFTMYEGENQMQIEVTAPDGKTVKVYTIQIHAQGQEYASDRMDLATKTEVGYGSLQLDRASNGNTIALVNEEGEKVEFAKGLGAHAQSEIAYNIEGQGYETFEAYVGIDFAQVSQISAPSSVTFRVVVDGVEKFNSGEMTVDSPMQKVEIDIKDASVIQLFADQGENNYNDHADWADAKFTKPLAEQPEVPTELSTAVLEYVLSLTEDVSTEGVVESVMEKYNAALKNAQDILERVQSGDADVTQEMIDDAWKELILAMQYLSFKQGDKTDLGKVIELAEEMAANLDNYLNDGKDGFNQALADAKVVYKDGNAMQTEVDTSWRTLLSAMAGLQLKPDKSMLQELLKEAAELLQSDYEEESFAAFRSVFADAKAVYEDEQAKAEDVKAAEGALKDAMEKLLPASGVDDHTVANAQENEMVISEDKNETQKDTGAQTVKSAKTSDATQAWAWLILMTGAALTALAIRKRKAK